MKVFLICFVLIFLTLCCSFAPLWNQRKLHIAGREVGYHHDSAFLNVQPPMVLFARNNFPRDGNRNKPKGKRTSNENFKSNFKENIVTQRPQNEEMTKSEIKARDLKNALKRPFVERILKTKERSPLSSCSEGQRFSGRIISITKFGLFVDIGTSRDGLLHVKDLSKDYFVSNHESKFHPGDDITVWIKFVDATAEKLGLQMYDPRMSAISPTIKQPLGSHKEEILRIPFDNLREGDAVIGKVIKSSEFGVDIDIGCELSDSSRNIYGYLHKRKMKLDKSNSRGNNVNTRNLKPWEICPMGSTVEGYVYEIDAARKRISLTTYPPKDWDIKLPPRQRDAVSTYEEDEDEEMGGEARAGNLRALQRTLSLSAQEDDEEVEEDDDSFDEDDDNRDDSYAYALADDDAEDDDDSDAYAVDDDEEDDIDGEELTAAEIQAIATARSKSSSASSSSNGRGQSLPKSAPAAPIAPVPTPAVVRKGRLIMNDFPTPSATAETDKNSQVSNDDDSDDDDEEEEEGTEENEDEIPINDNEMSIEELFEEISNGREEISFKSLKRWDYVSELMRDPVNKLNEDLLSQMYVQATGGKGAQLTMDNFEGFLEIFSNTLNLSDDNEVEEVEEEEQKGGRDGRSNVDGSKGQRESQASSNVRPSFQPSMQPFSLPQSQPSAGQRTAPSKPKAPVSSAKKQAAAAADTTPSKVDVISAKPKATRKAKATAVSTTTAENSQNLEASSHIHLLYNFLTNGKPYISFSDVLDWKLIKTLLIDDVVEEGSNISGLTLTYLKETFEKYSLPNKIAGTYSTAILSDIEFLSFLKEINLWQMLFDKASQGGKALDDRGGIPLAALLTWDIVESAIALINLEVVKSYYEKNFPGIYVADLRADILASIDSKSSDMKPSSYLRGTNNIVDMFNRSILKNKSSDSSSLDKQGFEGFVQELSLVFFVFKSYNLDLLEKTNKTEVEDKAKKSDRKISFDSLAFMEMDFTKKIFEYLELLDAPGLDAAFHFGQTLLLKFRSSKNVNYGQVSEVKLREMFGEVSSGDPKRVSFESLMQLEFFRVFIMKNIAAFAPLQQQETRSFGETIQESTSFVLKAMEEKFDLAVESSLTCDDRGLDLDGFVNMFRNFQPIYPPYKHETAAAKGSIDDKSKGEGMGKGKGKGEAKEETLEIKSEEINDELLSDVFKTLSKGNERVSMKNLLNWDFIFELLAEGVLSEEELQEEILNCGGTKKGVDIHAFDTLVDTLVYRYKNSLDDDEEEEEDDEDSLDEFQNYSQSIHADDAVSMSTSHRISKAASGEFFVDENDFVLDDTDKESRDSSGDSLEDDDEYLDIDIEAAFNEIGAGRTSVNIEEIKQWHLMKDMLQQGHISNDLIDETLDAVGIQDSKSIDIMEFEEFLDALLSTINDLLD